MSEGDRPIPRGRGAALIAALRKAQDMRASGDAPPVGVPEPCSSSAAPVEVSRAKGRAALLQRLAEIKQSQVGSASTASTTTPSGSVSEITERLSTTNISEPCYYRGTSGSQVPITCNYIKLMLSDLNKGVFEYHVRFEPEVDAKSARLSLVNSTLFPIKMFDGGSILYLPTQLADKNTYYPCKNPYDDTPTKMCITFIKKKKLGDNIHLYNILFKRIMRALLYSPIGRNYFDPQHSHMIPQHKLEVLPGYAVACDEYEGGVMLCLDTQHRVMRTTSVFEALLEIRMIEKERFMDAARNALIGTSVLTRYNNKTYRIDDIMWDANPTNTFETHDGGTISYIQYYKAQYNLVIKDERQPLLLNHRSVKISGKEEKEDRCVCLIPELCFMTGLTDDMRADFRVMKDVAQYTRVTPNQRMSALRTYIDNINKVPQAKKILEDWGFKIDNATVDIMARVLNPETILFGEGVTGYSPNADWNSLVTKNKVLGPIDLKSWYLFYTQRDEKFAFEFSKTITRLSGPMGMRINEPMMQKLKDDRTETYVNTLRALINPSIQIIVFICPTSRDDRYSAIKRLCCAQCPIPTQVINSRTLANPAKSRGITQKIALQINCKLGGTLWSVRIPVTNWMIVGIDIYHSPGTKKSVCAVISSLNESMTRWFSTSIFQEKELGDHLKMAFAKALEKFRETMGTFPVNVVIFRDGVGDGQLKHCREYEVAQFEQCLKDYSLTNTKITFVVVQKRINSRLFLKKDSSNMENPAPGTIVDHCITRKNWYDFFLVAQNVRQGTVTPTHYIVVSDSAKLKPDHVQKLAYKLCHLYYNWPGTIRVPAPCQYAHKLAYLVGQHICKTPSPVLSDRLFYL